MFTEQEQRIILAKLGYNVLKGNSHDDMRESGYNAIIKGNGDYYYVWVNEKKVSPSVIFAEELAKRIFNVEL